MSDSIESQFAKHGNFHEEQLLKIQLLPDRLVLGITWKTFADTEEARRVISESVLTIFSPQMCASMEKDLKAAEFPQLLEVDLTIIYLSLAEKAETQQPGISLGVEGCIGDHCSTFYWEVFGSSLAFESVERISLKDLIEFVDY
jgi:hypothetical protein